MRRLSIAAMCWMLGMACFSAGWSDDFQQTYQEALPETASIVTLDQAEKASTEATPASPETAQPPAWSSQQQTMADVMAKMMQLSQQVMNYQESLNHRVDTLQDRDQQIQNHMEQLEQVMQLFTQQLKSLRDQSDAGVEKATSPVSVSFSWGQIWRELSLWLWGVGGLFTGILLVGLGVLWGRSKQRSFSQQESVSSASALPQKQSTKNEYDFMSSKEAVPAKLDLARAYMAMDDTAAAVRVLQEVLASGDEVHQAMAKTLLDELKQTIDG